MFSRTLSRRAGPVAVAAVSAATRAPRACVAARFRLSASPMPLRAKVMAGSPREFTSIAPSKNNKLWQPQPGDDPEDVLFTNLYGLRTIELNRPRKYNSLDGSMIRKIVPRLLEWEKSDLANVIVVKGAGKAFCAGGDVAALAKSNLRGIEGQQESANYFALEYKLDHLIATYSKPYVAFLDGITMGGGVGLSVHAPFRIATENTVFAMPETNIGFFPDVGGSFFLPRMPGSIGTYLAMTSERLSGANVYYAGIATHYLHSTSLPSLEARLSELQFRDYDDLDTRLKSINATIEEFVTGLPADEPIQLAGDLRRAIDRCFVHNNVNEILTALSNEAKDTDNSDFIRGWANKTLKTLNQRSPTAVHVTLRQMRIGRGWTIAETFKREHQIASRFMRHPDFTNGVQSLLIEKSKSRPAWKPNTLKEITSSNNVTEPFFAPGGEFVHDPPELALLNDRDYADYPHKSLALPGEADVMRLVDEGGHDRRQVVNQLVGEYRAKQGVKEVVEEIVERKTVVDERGNAVWRYE